VLGFDNKGKIVIPALKHLKAGIHNASKHFVETIKWTPAFAGVTEYMSFIYFSTFAMRLVLNAKRLN
jgi:hypothetical protein